jgi:hypothetical protein
VSLAGNALLDAGLLCTASATTAAAAALAQGILGFVQKARHACVVCEVGLFGLGVMRIGWREAKATRSRTELCYMPWSYVLEFIACVIAR